MRPDEYAALVADIKERGIKVPLEVAGSTVLDGRHRLKAAIKIGLKEIPIVHARLDGESETTYLLKAAVLRRHLTDDQRSSMAALWAKQNPKPTGAAAHGKSYPRRVGVEKSQPALAEAARAVKVTESKARKAAELLSGAPALHKKVHAGELTLSEARRIHARETDRQRVIEAQKHSPKLEPHIFQAIVVDPPWDHCDEGDKDQMGRSRPTYSTMNIDRLLTFNIPSEYAAPNSHIYLWITNRSLPKGFDLLEAWGFRYVTCLTWCKPSIGIGNYFRNSTEHLLFGVRGSLSVLNQDVGTWFEARRGKTHSDKPDELYALVERMTPGPYLDVFGRRKREGWSIWNG